MKEIQRSSKMVSEAEGRLRKVPENEQESKEQ